MCVSPANYNGIIEKMQSRLSLLLFQKNSIFKAKSFKTQQNQSRPFLEIIKSIYTLNPTPFSLRKRVSKNNRHLGHLQKFEIQSSNQVQINSIDVYRGLESLITFNHIKRISLEWLGSIPKTQNDKITS